MSFDESLLSAALFPDRVMLLMVHSPAVAGASVPPFCASLYESIS